LPSAETLSTDPGEPRDAHSRYVQNRKARVDRSRHRFPPGRVSRRSGSRNGRPGLEERAGTRRPPPAGLPRVDIRFGCGIIRARPATIGRREAQELAVRPIGPRWTSDPTRLAGLVGYARHPDYIYNILKDLLPRRRTRSTRGRAGAVACRLCPRLKVGPAQQVIKRPDQIKSTESIEYKSDRYPDRLLALGTRVTRIVARCSMPRIASPLARRLASGDIVFRAKRNNLPAIHAISTC
jgi:hypothetical protein